MTDGLLSQSVGHRVMSDDILPPGHTFSLGVYF